MNATDAAIDTFTFKWILHYPDGKIATVSREKLEDNGIDPNNMDEILLNSALFYSLAK